MSASTDTNSPRILRQFLCAVRHALKLLTVHYVSYYQLHREYCHIAQNWGQTWIKHSLLSESNSKRSSASRSTRNVSGRSLSLYRVKPPPVTPPVTSGTPSFPSELRRPSQRDSTRTQHTSAAPPSPKTTPQRSEATPMTPCPRNVTFPSQDDDESFYSSEQGTI